MNNKEFKGQVLKVMKHIKDKIPKPIPKNNLYIKNLP